MLIIVQSHFAFELILQLRKLYNQKIVKAQNSLC